MAKGVPKETLSVTLRVVRVFPDTVSSGPKDSLVSLPGCL